MKLSKKFISLCLGLQIFFISSGTILAKPKENYKPYSFSYNLNNYSTDYKYMVKNPEIIDLILIYSINKVLGENEDIFKKIIKDSVGNDAIYNFGKNLPFKKSEVEKINKYLNSKISEKSKSPNKTKKTRKNKNSIQFDEIFDNIDKKEFENLKKIYIHTANSLIENTKKEIEDLENLREKNKKNKKWLFDYGKKQIIKERENLDKNILKELEFDEEKVVKKGKEHLERETEIEKLNVLIYEKNIKKIKNLKIEKFNDFLTKLNVSGKEIVHLNENFEDGYIYFDFENFVGTPEYIKNLCQIYFFSCLKETIEEDENNEFKQKYLKKYLKEIKKENEKIKNDKFFDSLTAECHCYGIQTLSYIFDINNIFGKTLFLNERSGFYGSKKELKYLVKYVKSEKFKQKLKDNLNKDYFKKLIKLDLNSKKELLQYANNAMKFKNNKNFEEDVIKSQKADIKDYKRWMKGNEEDNGDKDRNENLKERLEMAEDNLKNSSLIKKQAKNEKKDEIEKIKDIIDVIEYNMKKIENLKFEDFKKFYQIFDLKKLRIVHMRG